MTQKETVLRGTRKPVKRAARMATCVDLCGDSQPSPQPSPIAADGEARESAGQDRICPLMHDGGGKAKAKGGGGSVKDGGGSTYVIDLDNEEDIVLPEDRIPGDEIEVVGVKHVRPNPGNSSECEVQFLSADEAQKITPSIKAQNRELKRKLEEMQRLQQKLLAHVPDVPPYWRTKDTTQSVLARFDVPLESDAAVSLLEQWSSGGMSISQVRRIERIENMPIWCKYWQKKREIERELGADGGGAGSGSNVGKEMYW